MERSPELQAMADADESAIRDTRTRRNQYLGIAALLIVGGLAAYFVVMADLRPPRDMLEGDEDFDTTTFRPPSFERPEPEEPEVPSPPVEAAPAPIEVPPPPAPMVTPEPVDVFPDRYLSRMLVFDTPSDGGITAGVSGGGAPGVAGQDRSSQFLAAASSLGNRSATAEQLDRIDALIPEGTMIPGILETAVNSDLPGQLRAIVSEDVYSFDGRRVLIPTGARLIGEYQSDITHGQTRIFVVWTRLIRDDGVSIRLNSIGADSLGRSGITGHVDKKFSERFSSAILLSIVGAGASYLTGYGSQNAFGNSDDAARAEALARETIATTFSNMANQVLSENLSIPPTISVPQGERIFVYVRQDLDFSALYQDPVTEAMQEIMRERGLQ